MSPWWRWRATPCTRIIIIALEGCIPNLRSLMKLFSVEDALLATLQIFQGLFLWFSLVWTKITLMVQWNYCRIYCPNFQLLPVVPLFTLGSIYSSKATGTDQITEANKSNKHPNWQEADQLAIYKRCRGFKLGPSTENKSGCRPGLDWNRGLQIVSPAF